MQEAPGAQETEVTSLQAVRLGPGQEKGRPRVQGSSEHGRGYSAGDGRQPQTPQPQGRRSGPREELAQREGDQAEGGHLQNKPVWLERPLVSAPWLSPSLSIVCFRRGPWPVQAER